MPVVKADAYGHGAVAVARRLERAGATRLAVAYAEEGARCARPGVAGPIVVLAGFSAAQVALLAQHRLTPSCRRARSADALLAAPRGRAARGVHVKVDTGMARLGFADGAFVDAAARLSDAGSTSRA